MVDNIVIKPLGFVLMVTAHMVFNGHSKAEAPPVTGILGRSITLNFSFPEPHAIRPTSYVGVYREGEIKITECKNVSGCTDIRLDPEHNVVFYNISNLQRNANDTYWATLLGSGLPIKSNKVKLDVQEENRSSTVTPTGTPVSTTPENSGSSNFSSIHIWLVSPVVLLAAGLPCLIWCLVRTKDKQPQSQHNSNPTLQETIETNSVSPPSVVYSVLDFPKRPSTVLEIHPNDTEYAAVSYLSEKRITQG